MTEPDDEGLSGAAQLDEDELGLDPVEAGFDPPDHWSAADRFGTTPAEQREGESLADRLDEERPDIAVESDTAEPGIDPDTEWDADAERRDALGVEPE